MGFFSGVRRRIKKLIPKEVRPAIPFIAAALPFTAPAGLGALGSKGAMGSFLRASAAKGLTDDEADLKDILRTGAIAATPQLIDAGIGKLAAGDPHCSRIEIKRETNLTVRSITQNPLENLLEEANRRLQITLPEATIEITPLPDLIPIRLGLINRDFSTGPLAPETMRAVIKSPVYWAFCWGSGLAAASYILKNPKLVKDKDICDLGCGSGVVAIAAKKAGAKNVWACDIDQDALVASKLNSLINNVKLDFIQNLEELPEKVDLMFMADVLYDKNNCSLINSSLERSQKLLISDSRIKTLKDTRFSIFEKKTALTYPNLGEFDEYKEVTFFISST